MFQTGYSTLCGVKHGFGRSTWLGCVDLVAARKRIAIDQRMSRRTPLDLSEAHQVTPLEISIAMLEFP